MNISVNHERRFMNVYECILQENYCILCCNARELRVEIFITAIADDYSLKIKNNQLARLKLYNM